jgi:signal transduction histidine kinase
VRLARQIADSDPDAAKEMLDQIGTDLQDAVQELRNLAHGIYPPLLMDRGLAEALRAAGNRAPLPVDVEVDEAVGRYPQAVEAAIYFCCLEALQNVAKHASGARTVEISLHADGDLRFEVRDDGAGFSDADVRAGLGFTSMRDRIAAVGGRLSIRSEPGVGTTVAGSVPLETA